jgi:hypothetical protein
VQRCLHLGPKATEFWTTFHPQVKAPSGFFRNTRIPNGSSASGGPSAFLGSSRANAKWGVDRYLDCGRGDCRIGAGRP